MTKVALITGITGQDGSYLAELLIDKGYDVWGIIRRSSSINTARIDKIFDKITLKYGDLTDATNMLNILHEIKSTYSEAIPNQFRLRSESVAIPLAVGVRPTAECLRQRNVMERLEVYNLAAMSHVKVSFDMPLYTCDADAMGVLRLLESLRICGIPNEKIRFYQASTSEMFGKVVEVPQKETTPFYPRSPYGVAKLYGHWITKNYRESYDMFACSGILFNHESPRRGHNFVTRKITKALSSILRGEQSQLVLGNLNSLRDWGHAKDYVEGMWLMLQQDQPDDYVLSTNEYHSVREFVEKSFALKGFRIRWRGEGVDEVGYDEITGRELIVVSSRYFRPAEVDELLGDSTKARVNMGWTPKCTFDDLVMEMVESDCQHNEISQN